MTPFRVSILAAAVALAGCSVAPQQLTVSELQSINREDRTAAMEQVEPLGEVLSLDEAVARALKYNLDQRVKMLEQSLAAGQLESGKFDMLPKLLVDAGYDWRNNFSHRYDAPYETPTQFDRYPYPDVSSEKAHYSDSLRLSWNLLDFGASYYSAHQNADKLLVANEKRRKAMHLLVQKVRATYWRALAAEKLSERVQATINNAEQALAESQKLAAERVRTPDEPLRYQRNLLENLRLLESIQRELASARVELTQLVGALPGSRYKLEEPKGEMSPLTVPIAEMEERALVMNADLREQHLNARVAALDTRKELLKLLPGISLEYGTYHDDDIYLVNENWRAAGVDVSYNLFNLLAAPSRIDASEKAEEVARARRMALQMNVLAQVHLSSHLYTDALRQYQRADQIYGVDSQLEEIVRGKLASNMVSQQTAIAANVTTILSELRRHQAMSKLQQAAGQLQATLGMEPVLDSVDEIPLADLTQQVSGWLERGITSQSIALDTE